MSVTLREATHEDADTIAGFNSAMALETEGETADQRVEAVDAGLVVELRGITQNLTPDIPLARLDRRNWQARHVGSEKVRRQMPRHVGPRQEAKRQ